MAYGLAVIYGVMRVINLAHAGLMMLGAYITFALFTRFGLDPFLSLVIVAPLFFVIGVALYWTIGRRVTGAGSSPSMESLLVLFGVWLVLQNLAYVIWSGDTQSILTSYTMKSVKVAGVRLGVTSVLVFFASASSLIFLNILLNKTYLGKAIRAVSQNSTAARLAGIRSGRVSTIAFGIGSSLSAFAGGLLTLLFSFTPDFGHTFQLKSFAIIVLGGLESFPGVALGALVLAVIESFSILIPGWRGSLVNLLAFTLLVAGLVLLPGGIASLLERRGKSE